jgi:flagellar biogenesis protein FliO
MFKKFLFVLFCCFSYVLADDPPPPEKAPLPIEQPAPPSLENQPEPSEVVTTSYESAFIKMLLTLGALLFLIILTVWMMRRMSSGRMFRSMGSSQLKIVDKKVLSAKSMLYIVEVEGKRVLISESQLEVRPIAEIETPVKIES